MFVVKCREKDKKQENEEPTHLLETAVDHPAAAVVLLVQPMGWRSQDTTNRKSTKAWKPCLSKSTLLARYVYVSYNDGQFFFSSNNLLFFLSFLYFVWGLLLLLLRMPRDRRLSLATESEGFDDIYLSKTKQAIHQERNHPNSFFLHDGQS